MSTFKERMEQYLGSTSANSVDVGQALTDATTEVINILPDKCAWMLIQLTGELTTNGYDLLPNCRVFGVERDDIHCTRTPHNVKSRLTDTQSLYAPSSDNPVFVLEHGKISVFPLPSVSEAFEVMYIPYPTIAGTDTIISQSELTGVTVSTGGLFTKANHNLVVGQEVSLLSWAADDGDPANLTELTGMQTQVATTPLTSTFTLEGVSTVSEVSTGIVRSGVNFPRELEPTVVLGAAAKVKLQLINDQRETVDSLEPPSISLDSAPTITDLDLSSITAPTLESITILYDEPVYDEAGEAIMVGSDIEDTFIATLTDITASTFGTLPTVPSYIKPVADIQSDLNQVETYIATNEDIELATGQLEKINRKIALYSQDIQNNLNDFTKEGAEYKAEVEKVTNLFHMELKNKIADATFESQRVAEQGKIDFQVAVSKAKLEQDAAKTNAAMKIATITLNSKQNTALSLANAAKKLEALGASAKTKVTEYQANIALYAKDIESANLEYGANAKTSLSSWHQTNTQKIQKYQFDLGRYSAELKTFAANTEMQMKEYALLKKEFGDSLKYFIARYTGGGVPSQKQEQKKQQQQQKQRQQAAGGHH